MAKAKVKKVDAPERPRIDDIRDPDCVEFLRRVYRIVGSSLKNRRDNPGDHYTFYEDWDAVKDENDLDRQTRLEGNKEQVGGTRCSSWDLDSGDNDSHGYTIAEADPNLNILDDVLSDICPNITYLQYKKLIVEASVQTQKTSVNEYYGNSSDYLQKYVLLGNLYDAMVTLGLYKTRQ
jgi:hypothetical protein